MNKVQLSRSTQKNLSNLGRALAKQFDRDLQEVDQNIDSMITLGTKSEEIELSSDQVLRQLNRFKKTPLFGKWQANPEMNPEKWELALALRCSPDSPKSVWILRIETLRADAQISNDSEVLRFIDLMLEKEPGWFDDHDLPVSLTAYWSIRKEGDGDKVIWSRQLVSKEKGKGGARMNRATKPKTGDTAKTPRYPIILSVDGKRYPLDPDKLLQGLREAETGESGHWIEDWLLEEKRNRKKGS